MLLFLSIVNKTFFCHSTSAKHACEVKGKHASNFDMKDDLVCISPLT
jgi:hypothetical protein